MLISDLSETQMMMLVLPILPNMWALKHCFHHDFPTEKEKFRWMMACVFLPCLGGLAYILVGRRHASKEKIDVFERYGKKDPAAAAEQEAPKVKKPTPRDDFFYLLRNGSRTGRHLLLVFNSPAGIRQNRVSLDYLRHRKKMADTPVEELENCLVEEEGVERAYLREEQKIAVHRAMQTLKDEYRQVLYLVFFEGFTNPEAAQAMDKSVRQIENLVYRAKQALKAQLEKENFVYEEL